MRHHLSRGASLALLAVVYVLAVLVGIFAYVRASASMPEVWALLLADVVATVYVWGMGLVYENVSVYDPYWSVAPPVMFLAWAIFKDSFSLPVILLLVAIWYWGIRLTGNWAVTFEGIGHEDWRYTKYREKLSPFLFHVTNFFGLNMMPTLLVFACMMPGFRLIENPGTAHWTTWLGFSICMAATAIELSADTQIHRYRAEHPGQVCDVGLWKHGRHPNYFGEISMWWGVWVMYASSAGIDWLIMGPVAMTALFLFISIPMMERRQLRNKPGYAGYKNKTRMLI